MPQNKKHHFVPRFYLKRFSGDGKSINLWNIPNQRKVTGAKLKNQCYRSYFYGKEPEVELALGDVEGNAAAVFRLIEKHCAPPRPGSSHHVLLILYLLMQYGRTTYSADSVNEMHDKLAKHIYGPKMEAEGFDLNNFTIGIQEPARYAMGILIQNYPLLLDLDYKLLMNGTDTEFVTSDNPVVPYNQFFAFRRFGSNTGLACKGLQVFLPLDPKRMLVFFDSAVYSVGSFRRAVIVVDQPKDVYELNTLQLCSAAENVYFRDPTLDVQSLHRKGAPFRRTAKTDFVVFPGEVAEKRRSEYLATSRQDVRTNLKLSFFGQTRGAKRWLDTFKKQKMQPSNVVRNRKLCDDHDEFLKQVEEQKYKPGDFFQFLEDKPSAG